MIKPKDKTLLEFPELANYYGSLKIREGGGVYFWGIWDFTGIKWKPIPKSLYDELKKYHKEHKEHRKTLARKDKRKYV